MNSVHACISHGEQPVTAANYYEWHVRCRSLFCSYGRWTGPSEELAEYRRDRHSQRTGHLTGKTLDRITWDGRGSVYRDDGDKPRKTPESPVPLQYSFDSEPPF